MAIEEKEEIYGVINVCCVCHRVINEKETLNRIEDYARKYAGIKFSHGLCARCFKLEMAKMKAHIVEYQRDSIRP